MQSFIEAENSGDSDKTVDDIWAAVKSKYSTKIH
jgi:hypothetical protein